MKTFSKEYGAILRKQGIVFDNNPQFLVERDEFDDISMAMDSQQGLTTVSSAGIPAYMTNLIDPKPIKVLFAPMNATNVFGEQVRGSWTTKYMTFKFIEHTGEVASYGDYNNTGISGANVNFPERQSYLFQTITQYGDLEVDEGALAQIDFIAEKNIGSILALNKFQNQTYLYGVAGLRCYGMLNDPDLPAPVAPGKKAYGSLTSGPWMTGNKVTATPLEVFEDFQRLLAELISQSKGLIDTKTAVKLVIPPLSQLALTSSNETFATTAMDMITKNFNVTVETVPEYATTGGNVAQLIAMNIQGQETGMTATNLKLRSGRIIPDLSSFKQKKTQGTWGTIIYQPWAISQMIGI